MLYIFLPLLIPRIPFQSLSIQKGASVIMQAFLCEGRVVGLPKLNIYIHCSFKCGSCLAMYIAKERLLLISSVTHNSQAVKQYRRKTSRYMSFPFSISTFPRD